MKHSRVVLLCLVCAAALPARAQFSCPAARDLVVRAIEGVQGEVNSTNLEEGIALIEDAENICPSYGDAWYYNALFLAKSGEIAGKAANAEQIRKRQALIDGDTKSAVALSSPAQRDHLSPFVIATPPDSAQPVGPVQQKWALLVGVSAFAHGFDSLKYTGKDASDLYGALTDPAIGRFQKDHVRLLTDKEATLTNIKAELNVIARQAGPSDLVLVFIASHGTARGQDRAKTGQLSYIVTYDTEKDSHQDRTFATALPMTDVSQIIRSRMLARRTVLILDTCYSGNAGDGVVPTAPNSAQMDNLKDGVGRVIISASKDQQTSNESDDFENGVFTHFFIDGLRQQGGKQPLSQLFAYVSSKVPSWNAGHKLSAQDPMMFRSEHGEDIVIGVDGTAASSQSGVLLRPTTAPGASFGSR